MGHTVATVLHFSFVFIDSNSVSLNRWPTLSQLSLQFLKRQTWQLAKLFYAVGSITPFALALLSQNDTLLRCRHTHMATIITICIRAVGVADCRDSQSERLHSSSVYLSVPVCCSRLCKPLGVNGNSFCLSQLSEMMILQDAPLRKTNIQLPFLKQWCKIAIPIWFLTVKSPERSFYI